MVVSTIVTGDPTRASQAREDFPSAAVVEAPEFWARLDEHDVVVVATPTASHEEVAGRAVESGVAVVVDKPIAPTATEAQRLVELAQKAGVVLTVFQNRRWDSDFLTIERLLAEGALGEVRRFESRFERWRPDPNPGAWRERESVERGGGVLLDLGSHLVDQALTIFGPVTSVYGEVSSRRGGADDDVFLALSHASGVRSHLWASAVSAAPGPRFRVLGSGGAFVVDGLDGQEDALRAGRRPHEPTFGEEPPERWGRLFHGDDGTPVRSERGRWSEFYGQVRSAIREGGRVPAEPADAVATSEVIDAARRSAREGRVVPITARHR